MSKTSKLFMRAAVLFAALLVGFVTVGMMYILDSCAVVRVCEWGILITSLSALFCYVIAEVIG